MAKTKAAKADKKNAKAAGGAKGAGAKAKKGVKAKPASKSAIYQRLAEATSLSRKQVAGFFDELTKLIHEELSASGPGVFTIPGLVRMKRVVKKARPARPGAVRHPLRPASPGSRTGAAPELTARRHRCGPGYEDTRARRSPTVAPARRWRHDTPPSDSRSAVG